MPGWKTKFENNEKPVAIRKTDKVFRKNEANEMMTYTGNIFPNNGPKPNDVKQSVAGTCYIVGALRSMAMQNPESITNMIKDNGNGTVTVRFYKLEEESKESKEGKESKESKESKKSKKKIPLDVTVDKTLPKLDINSAPWVKLIEKAYLLSGLKKFTQAGPGNARQYPINEEPNMDIDDVNWGDSLEFLDHVYPVDIKTEVKVDPHKDREEVKNTFAKELYKAYANGGTLVVATFDHIMQLESVDEKGIHMFNQWGGTRSSVTFDELLGDWGRVEYIQAVYPNDAGELCKQYFAVKNIKKILAQDEEIVTEDKFIMLTKELLAGVIPEILNDNKELLKDSGLISESPWAIDVVRNVNNWFYDKDKYLMPGILEFFPKNQRFKDVKKYLQQKDVKEKLIEKLKLRLSQEVAKGEACIDAYKDADFLMKLRAGETDGKDYIANVLVERKKGVLVDEFKEKNPKVHMTGVNSFSEEIFKVDALGCMKDCLDAVENAIRIGLAAHIENGKVKHDFFANAFEQQFQKMKNNLAIMEKTDNSNDYMLSMKAFCDAYNDFTKVVRDNYVNVNPQYKGDISFLKAFAKASHMNESFNAGHILRRDEFLKTHIRLQKVINESAEFISDPKNYSEKQAEYKEQFNRLANASDDYIEQANYELVKEFDELGIVSKKEEDIKLLEAISKGDVVKLYNEGLQIRNLQKEDPAFAKLVESSKLRGTVGTIDYRKQYLKEIDNISNNLPNGALLKADLEALSANLTKADNYIKNNERINYFQSLKEFETGFKNIVEKYNHSELILLYDNFKNDLAAKSPEYLKRKVALSILNTVFEKAPDNIDNKELSIEEKRNKIDAVEKELEDIKFFARFVKNGNEIADLENLLSDNGIENKYALQRNIDANVKKGYGEFFNKIENLSNEDVQKFLGRYVDELSDFGIIEAGRKESIVEFITYVGQAKKEYDRMVYINEFLRDFNDLSEQLVQNPGGEDENKKAKCYNRVMLIKNLLKNGQQLESKEALKLRIALEDYHQTSEKNQELKKVEKLGVDEKQFSDKLAQMAQTTFAEAERFNVYDIDKLVENVQKSASNKVSASAEAMVINRSLDELEFKEATRKKEYIDIIKAYGRELTNTNSRFSSDSQEYINLNDEVQRVLEQLNSAKPEEITTNQLRDYLHSISNLGNDYQRAHGLQDAENVLDAGEADKRYLKVNFSDRQKNRLEIIGKFQMLEEKIQKENKYHLLSDPYTEDFVMERMAQKMVNTFARRSQDLGMQYYEVKNGNATVAEKIYGFDRKIMVDKNFAKEYIQQICTSSPTFKNMCIEIYKNMEAKYEKKIKKEMKNQPADEVRKKIFKSHDEIQKKIFQDMVNLKGDELFELYSNKENRAADVEKVSKKDAEIGREKTNVKIDAVIDNNNSLH